MSFSYIPRSLEAVLRSSVETFPSITLTGPRQSGKTTLLKRIFGDTYQYVSMEVPDMRDNAESDPRGFLATFKPPVIIDEAQYAPILFPYIKEIIDNRRDESGMFILSGSQNFALLSHITESLAGRTDVIHLMPLSQSELAGVNDSNFLWERGNNPTPHPPLDPDSLWRSLWAGSYPEILRIPSNKVSRWHENYIQMYLERDVRSLRQVGDLSQFQTFMRVLAARSAQVVNLSDLARDVGISSNTAKHWLSVLEASFVIIILRPYFANVGKRLIKSPKIYFTDTGVLCNLTRNRLPEMAASGPMAGAIFETAVVTEVFKRYLHRGEVPHIYFWRTAIGTEVDLLIDEGRELIPLEVKHTATPRPQMATSIRSLFKDFPDRVTRGYVVYPGDIRIPVSPNVTAIPFTEL